jgi:hypothetical protein
MTAAGGTLVLGGKTYLLKQLTLGDYGQVQAWLRQRLPKPFAVVAEAIKDLLPIKDIDPEGYAEARRQLVLAAMEDAKRGDGSGAPPEMVAECLNSPDGIAYLLWLCARKEQPQTTYEEIRAGVNTADLKDLKKHLDAVNLFASDDDGEEGNPFVNPQTPPPTK